MRRPLDWIVVSISLMVLAANRMLVTPDPAPMAQAPALRAEAIGTEPTAQVPASPFAYVRSDGSLLYVPAQGAGAWLEPPSQSGLEDDHAGSGFHEALNLETAVYSWSSPAPQDSP